MEQMITVIGAGPIGLRAATGLKNEGWDVTVLEEHSEIGVPENCSGLLSVNGLQKNKIDVSEVTVNKIFGAKIFSPEKTFLKIERKEPVALVVERAGLDKKLEKKAEKKGIQIRKNTRMIDVRKDTIFVQHEQRGEMMKTRFVVGADGAASKTRKLVNPKIDPKAFVRTIQVKAKGSFDDRLVEVHLGDFCKGFFAWVIPENKTTARIGLGVSGSFNARENFNKFTKEMEIEVLNESSFVIPVTRPIKEIQKDNIFLVGDAAYQTKATTGGGIITGSIAADIAVKTISDHLKHKKPLTDYWKNLSPLNKELELHWKVRKYFNSLNDKQINSLIRKFKKAGMEEFLEKHGDMDFPSKFINKMMLSPSKWGLLPTGLKVLFS
ncbi:NAD(P)/FAD-dependent oxidoreductase [Candidatus Micrarchaeota archaeon]|nr:NAD(P)/FAD-dependent oxidoreductase [Candidatus Micrarchaeota archaeon]